MYDEDEFIITRQPYEWHMVKAYLSAFNALCRKVHDKKFQKMLVEMTEYVNGRLVLPKDSEVIDCYVAMVQCRD